MELEKLDGEFTVCKVTSFRDIACDMDFCFIARTDHEISLVCPAERVPAHTAAREDGWRAFRIEGVLDFSLTGILAGIAAALAVERIPIFAISTFNTDYVLVKKKELSRALEALRMNGYDIFPEEIS